MRSPVHIPGIELGDELGRGACSVVYRALQGTRPCAVKMPLVRGRWTRWVYREAVALARVHHAGLPAVFEVGEVDDLPYIAMELVEGETLAEKLQRGRLDESETIALALQLVAALKAAHRVGILHRDVKPRNIVVGQDGLVRLIDFGFAIPIDLAGRDRDQAGTRRYAAPEQLAAARRLDGRADLYALGRVLSECIAERSPRSVTEADPGGPIHASGLSQVIAGLVAEDPNDRYPDASALQSELEWVKSGQSARGPQAYEADRDKAALVARSAELDSLNRSATGGTTTSVVLLRGLRGSGKTRLLQACATTARKVGDRKVLEVACQEGDAPLSTLRRLFEAFADSLGKGPGGRRAEGERLLREAAGDHLGPFARLIAPALSEGLHQGDVALDVAPGGFPEGTADLIVRLARSAGPLLICVDDLQWVDPVSRDAILRLAQRGDEAPITFVLSSRDPLPAALEPLLAVSKPRLSNIELSQLNELQVLALVASHLGSPDAELTLVRRIAAMADGTPMGVLEVLGAFLDSGALRPQTDGWLLDVLRAERVVLPSGSLALLGHRVGELPRASRRVLEAAAVIGTTFDEQLLARAVGLDAADLDYALADAQQAGLVESAGHGRHRLVHDSLRESIVDALDESTRRKLHQRVAELLDTGDSATFETLCASAVHYAAGELEKTPKRAYGTARTAADAALERFDNETSLRFLELARTAAPVAEIKLDSVFHQIAGEAHLRLGALEDSLEAFEAALECTSNKSIRAFLLGRLAWVHQTGDDPERAWRTLERAFDALGVRMPVEKATSAASTLGHLARAELRRRIRRHTPVLGDARAEIELLCQLHYQNARLGSDYGKPMRFIQSTIEALKLGETLGPSRAQARARAAYGVGLSLVGSKKTGSAEVERGQQMALNLGDPSTFAFCVQMHAVTACVAGEFDRALALLRDCLDVHGPWLELNEYCLDSINGDFIESLRGRPAEAMAWIARAIDRQRRHRHDAIAAKYIIHRGRAAHASLGHDPTLDEWLTAQLNTPSTKEGMGDNFNKILSWGPRARLFLETDNLETEFEALVFEFEAERLSPRTVHPIVVEYYIAVAHARLQQCLRARSFERARLIALLSKSFTDLRAAAKVPLYKAHCIFIEGCLAWFEGSASNARAHFAKAEALAEQETCPWVLSAIARVRAHMLRGEGKLDAARDQARFSEMISVQYGAEPHARWVREEFALAAPVVLQQHESSRSSVSNRSSRLRRHLASLLHVVRRPTASGEPKEQAVDLLDNLLEDLDAERGLIWFIPGPGVGSDLVVGRTRRKTDWSVTAPRGVPIESNTGRTLSVPLFLYEQIVGGVRLERGAAGQPFSAGDHDLLVVLSHQIPVTFEIGRLLVEREQLQKSLLQVQKMEAVGQLAGGVAHDFNNMLTVIRNSLDFLRGTPSADDEVNGELSTISNSVEHAAQLTQQLLGFSRHQPIPLTSYQINDALLDVEPIISRLLGEDIRLELLLASDLHRVDTIRAAFDQVVVNLVVNARDAMPLGGVLRIETKNVVLDDAAVRRGAPDVGSYVVIEVTDSGQGMTPEVLSHVFDPFFTTKSRGTGTGLGLTTTYAFVKKCRGHIEVVSEPGRGATFSIFLPESRAILSALPTKVSVSAAPPSVGGSTILVVDDDFGVRSSMEKILKRAGYRVLLASGGTDALELVELHGSDIALVIIDMMMPGMNGADLGRHLLELRVRAPLLFVSGFSPEALPAEGALANHADLPDRFLQKPFQIPELLARVRRLLEAA